MAYKILSGDTYRIRSSAVLPVSTPANTISTVPATVVRVFGFTDGTNVATINVYDANYATAGYDAEPEVGRLIVLGADRTGCIELGVQCSSGITIKIGGTGASAQVHYAK